MKRSALALLMILAASVAIAGEPADVVLEYSGIVFVNRGGENLRVEEAPYVLELNDVITVNPGGRAVLIGDPEADPTVLTIESGPRTISEARPLLAAMLSPSEAEEITAGANVVTLRSGESLSPGVSNPRNTALLEVPSSITVTLPIESAQAFLDDSDSDVLRANAIFSTEEGRFHQAEVSWTRQEIEDAVSGTTVMPTREINLTEVTDQIPVGAQINVHLFSPALQMIAIGQSAMDPPPEDRCYFGILSESQREAYEADMDQAETIAAAICADDPDREAVFLTRVMLAHGLNQEALNYLADLGADTEQIDLLTAGIQAHVNAVWDPEDQAIQQ